MINLVLSLCQVPLYTFIKLDVVGKAQIWGTGPVRSMKFRPWVIGYNGKLGKCEEIEWSNSYIWVVSYRF